MKKRLIYICMFASLLTFSSCNEALDVAPDYHWTKYSKIPI